MPKGTVKMEHPVAGKSRASRAKKVLDKSQDIFEKLDQEEVEEPKEAPSEESITPKKLKGLKDLLYLGKVTHHVEVDGFIFKMNSLNHKEARNVAKRILLLSDEEKLVESNILHVAASLSEINGHTVEEAFAEMFGEEDLDDGEVSMGRIDMALEILSELSNHLSGKLIQEYFNLSNESKGLLNPKDSESEIKK
jgi:hypothetical protein